MPEKKYEQVKKEIRSVLLTFQSGVPLSEFLKTYRGLLGEPLPSRTCGFSSDVAFLQSMPDVVDVTTSAQGRIHLTGIADKASQHIQKLVSKQRKSKNNSNSNKRQPVRMLPFSVRDVKPFLPGPLRAEILQLMASYDKGVKLSTFAIAYHRKFNKYLPLTKGLDTLERMVKLISDLELREEGIDKVIYLRNSSASEGNKSAARNINLLEENLSNIHVSGISEDVLQSFQMVLQKCSDGILSIHFPILYENLTGKEFDLHSYGYNSLADLVDALPHIFKRTADPTNCRQWIILPAKKSVESISKENSAAPILKNISSDSLTGIPADVSSPNLHFFGPKLPEGLNLNLYVPVWISAILDPSHFWFQLQTDEEAKNFQEFEKNMEKFYNFYAGDEYKMKTVDISIGATCVVKCPDDNQWFRAVVKSMPTLNILNVYYVDHGGRQNVPRDNVYYVKSEFHDFPAYAFEAQLANLKPPNNESSWNNQSQRRFIELCESPVIMAYLIPSENGNYSVYLCDTRGETDIHFNDTLVNEGFAEFYIQNQHSENNNFPYEADVTYEDNGAVENFENGSFSGSDQCTLLSDSRETCSRPDISTVRRKLSFSAKELSDDRPDSSKFEIEKVKRYVKIVWGNKVTHVINIENKLFMTCGELCRCLWSDETSNFLMKMLLYKEVKIPFLELKEEDNTDLFKQCRWCKIPDMEELDLNSSNLILCPLKEALKVLDIFGHPSVVLRLVLQDEIINFDPNDPIWKNFDFEEPLNWDDAEKNFLQELDTLCLYNLKAKHEALKVKRLKLLRTDSAIALEERKRIEKLQIIIEKRIKQIEEVCNQSMKQTEEICTQYSS